MKKSKMAGRSKTPPASEANFKRTPKKPVDAVAAAVVTSAPVSLTAVHQEKVMSFILVTSGKSKLIRYGVSGLRGLIRLSPTLLNGSPAPAEVASLDALPWAEPKAGKAPVAPRVKMTAEEKQAAAAARKNRTPAQIIADAEVRAQKTLALAQARAAKLAHA